MSADLKLNQRAQSLDRVLEKTQAALLARFAPDTRVRRVRWSQGETQLFELGSGAPLPVRPRWVGRRVRDRAYSLSARTEPPRSRGRSSGSRAGRSVRLPRRGSARPRSDVPARHPRCARALDRRRGCQLDGRALVRRLRDRRSEPSLASCTGRRSRRVQASGAVAVASARPPNHRAEARQVRVLECDARREPEVLGPGPREAPRETRRSAARRRRRAHATQCREHAWPGEVHRQCPATWVSTRSDSRRALASLDDADAPDLARRGRLRIARGG